MDTVYTSRADILWLSVFDMCNLSALTMPEIGWPQIR
jgi:hypothetical protein